MIELYINQNKVIGFIKIKDNSLDKYFHYKDYVHKQILNGNIYNLILLTTTKIDYQPAKSALYLKDSWETYSHCFSISKSIWQELEQYI